MADRYKSYVSDGTFVLIGQYGLTLIDLEDVVDVWGTENGKMCYVTLKGGGQPIAIPEEDRAGFEAALLEFRLGPAGPLIVMHSRQEDVDA